MSTTTVETPEKTELVFEPSTAQESNLGLRRPDFTKGLVDWMTTVDHKKIGILYLFAGIFFFIVGGIEALLIRVQLAQPMNDFITAQQYNQLFTMHGTTMIFLAVMPMSAGFFNYLIPLQIGARDVAFPRLNAFSLWCFIGGAIVLNISFLFQFLQYAGVDWFNITVNREGYGDYTLTDIVPGMGWFAYAPLSNDGYSGIGSDFWIFGLQVLGIASLAASFNFITTILNMRAPGMKMMRLPAFTWMTLITAFLIIFAFPAITIALAELMFDRTFGTNFFRVEEGGQPILWQHLFWVFGHPEVYILVLPAMGIVSEILPTFSRRPLFGYPIIVFSGAVIGFLGFAVWSHHMFTTGLGKIATAAFSLLTMAIAVPTGVKIFNWIGTLWQGRIRFTAPMVFALGFIWMFMMGGFSGIMHSAAPADAQQQDSYFVIAHFHYVLIGGVVLALLGGIYFWLPKMFGKMWTGNLGYWSALLVNIGLNVTCFPMQFLGLLGMPRRTHTYLEGNDWGSLNLICSIGAFVLAFGVLIFLIDIFLLVKKGKPAADDAWGEGRTLEWYTSSPPAVHNFDATPEVQARDALWAHKHDGPKYQIKDIPEPHGVHMPSQSWWPFFGALGLTIMATSMSLHAADLLHSFGWLAIFGLGMTVVSVFLWALEGPGGFHIHFKKSGASEQSQLQH